MIVVDTSVLIGFLKAETSPAIEILEKLEVLAAAIEDVTRRAS